MACSWYDPFSYGDCAGQVAKSVAGDAFESIARSFGHAAQDATSWLWKQLGTATAVSLGGAGFAGFSNGIALLTRREESMIAVSNFIGLPLLFFSSILIARDLIPTGCACSRSPTRRLSSLARLIARRASHVLPTTSSQASAADIRSASRRSLHLCR